MHSKLQKKCLPDISHAVVKDLVSFDGAKAIIVDQNSAIATRIDFVLANDRITACSNLDARIKMTENFVLLEQTTARVVVVDAHLLARIDSVFAYNRL